MILPFGMRTNHSDETIRISLPGCRTPVPPTLEWKRLEEKIREILLEFVDRGFPPEWIDRSLAAWKHALNQVGRDPVPASPGRGTGRGAADYRPTDMGSRSPIRQVSLADLAGVLTCLKASSCSDLCTPAHTCADAVVTASHRLLALDCAFSGM